jgi:hypothetical protein
MLFLSQQAQVKAVKWGKVIRSGGFIDGMSIIWLKAKMGCLFFNKTRLLFLIKFWEIIRIVVLLFFFF